jgi:ribosomal protein L37E
MTSKQNDYKELPCRRCGRVWKWAFDKKTEPCCPEGYGCAVEGPSTRELFDEVIRRLDVIEMKIRSIPPVYPTPSLEMNENMRECSKCGMVWKGVMGYVCSNTQCPVQPKVSWQSHNTSSK